MGKYDDPTVVPPADGVARGDGYTPPSKGTGTGFVNGGGTYEADVGQNATNRAGGFHGGSDPMGKEFADDERQTMTHTRDRIRGRRMSGTDSDPMMDDTPGDEATPGDRD